MRAALALVMVCACAKAPPPVKVVPPPVRDVRAEVGQLLTDAYLALEAQDPLKLKPLMTPDVMAFGLGPADTFAERETLIDRVRQNLLGVGLREETVKVTSRQPVIGLSRTQDSAWVFDAPKIEVISKGKTETWLPRITGHAALASGAWRFDAVHVSLGIDDDKLYAPDASRKYLPPADVLAERGPESDQIIGLTRRLLEDLTVKIERTSDRPEVVLLGTDPTEVFIGGANFKALVKPKLAEIKRSVFTLKIEGPLRARLAPSGKTGWLAANVVLRLGKKPQVLPPFRTLWVFEEVSDGTFTLVQEHQSLALKTELREPATAAAIAAWAAAKPQLPRAEQPRSTPDAGTTTEPPIGVW